jgi:UPF0755 protein
MTPSDNFGYDEIFNEPEPEPVSPRDRLIQFGKSKAAIAVGVLIVLLIIGNLIGDQFSPPGEQGAEVTIEVEPGATTTQITEQLAEAGVVPDALAMRIWIRVKSGGPFQAGEYAFRQNSSAGSALAILEDGPKERTDRLIVPEGRTLDQVATIVGDIEGFSRERFLEVANSGTIRSSMQPAEVDNLEGFLFPDTYFLSASDNEEVLIQRMVTRFENVASETGLDDAPRIIQRNTFDTLIIASIIEAEAKVPQDRGRISQVIQNRLAQDMNLQIDATVLYALGRGLDGDRASVSYNQLEVDSPYNTYQNPGLPPGPISNPGEASIRAALQPEPGPWLFYVKTEESGAHSFASTDQEHARNVEIARSRGFVD